jgi:dipeptidyl aminopeptidase/acylaminoacyl peptidase
MIGFQAMRRLLMTGLVLALPMGPVHAAPGGQPAPDRTPGAPPRVLTDPASLVSPVMADAKPVPIADLFFLRSSWFGNWTPDGKSIVIATDLTGRTNLWKVPVDGGFPVQLQQSEDRAFYPVVTPDGHAVIYASDKGGREIYDLFAVPLAGGAPVNLTASPDASETSPVVAADSRSVAFERRVATESATNVALLSLADGKSRLLTHEREEGAVWRPIAFSRDGKRLIANRADATSMLSTVWSIDPATGAATMIAGTAGHGYAAASDLSPDDRLLALTIEDGEGRRQAAILDLAGGKPTPIQPGAWEQTAGKFSPDGRALLMTINLNGRYDVHRYDLATHAATRLPLPEGVNSSTFFGELPAYSADGSRILFPHSGGNTPFDYWVYDVASANARPVTRLGLASVDPAALPPTRIVSYRSRDNMTISAILWMPYNLKRDGSAPAVVIPHGGPTGQTSDSFDATAAALASRGYVVIAPNPRGSTGYGRAFADANRGDLGGGDLEDEANAARFLVRSGYVDAKKIGITGGSYGGYMTVMAVAKMPDFWAAGVEEYGIVNWRSMWERGSPALRAYQRGLIGDPAKDQAVYDRVSPLTYLKQTKAPLLVLQGENDIRVPRNEAEQIVRVLKEAGRTVDAHYYPEEGHGFVKRENQIDALERTVGWFDLYLKGEKPAAAK